jgi:hypothetical protein
MSGHVSSRLICERSDTTELDICGITIRLRVYKTMRYKSKTQNKKAQFNPFLISQSKSTFHRVPKINIVASKCERWAKEIHLCCAMSKYKTQLHLLGKSLL